MQQKLHSFPVIYDKTTYLIDLDALISSSQMFKELIDPFINDYAQLKELHLDILCNQFNKRDINNFLRICQNLPTDVQNSEMREICEISKMFEAESIYKKGLSFIQAYLDPNFKVPDNKYDGKAYLIVSGETKHIYHDPNISESIFEEDIKSKNDATSTNNSKISEAHVIVYQIICENRKFKRSVYKLTNDDQIICSAKLKYNEIFFSEGNDIHIRDKEKQIAHILRKETTISNLVATNDQTFEIKYNHTRGSAYFPMSVSFQFKNKTLNLTQRKRRYDPETGKYSLNYNGKYNHVPIQSSKNTIMDDDKGKPVLIIRQMSTDTYEIETLSVFDPLIIFSIGLSGILGPFFDPWAAAQYK